MLLVEKIKPLTKSDFDNIKERYSHYLKEIKKRFFVILYVFLGATLLGFIFYEQIIKFIVKILSLNGVNIVFTSPFQFINLSISVGLAVGLVAVFPVLIAQILSFLKPALKKKEFKRIFGFIPFSLILFIIGFGLGAYIMKWQIDIFRVKAINLGIGNMFDISSLLSTIVLVSTFMGLAFQFPLILILLMKIGIVNRKALAKKRLWIYLGSFVFAMLLPADSLIADFFLTLPLVILFELTLLGSYFPKKNED